MAFAYATAIFVIVPIDNVMAAVFNTPVTTIDRKQAFGVGLFRRSTGYAISDIMGMFAGFFVNGFSFDNKSLANMRKVQIIVEFGCSPYFTSFDSPVIRRGAIDKSGRLPILKIERNVIKKTRLVVFNGEMIMCFTLPDQIVGYFTLG